MKLRGPAGRILGQLLEANVEAEEALVTVSRIHGQLLPYQAAALWVLVRRYNRPGVRILEIGTLAGYSAAIMALAAPEAFIITLNPAAHEVTTAQANLKPYSNVQVIQMASWDYLRLAVGEFDVIFVDGDHKRVARDLPWWERLRPGGLMLFHDYCPEGSGRPCPPVYEMVNRLVAELGKPEPDVLVVDDEGIGLAGIYKRGEWLGVL